MPDLLLGCGSSRERRIKWGGRTAWADPVTLDFNDDHKPDVVHDISKIPLPFPDNTFDEIHAYEVMEHVGQQGDWKFFFEQWSDLWRILKPDGVFCGTSPAWNSPWAWGDPGHTRIISMECLVFLHQPSYTAQVGKTPMTDYRFCYKADFQPLHIKTNDGLGFEYVLKAVKPSRITV